MTLKELQNQALQSSITDRWHLVHFLLNSIQQETPSFSSSNPNMDLLTGLDPWTQSLIGVIHQLSAEEPIESYVDYLEEKYN